VVADAAHATDGRLHERPPYPAEETQVGTMVLPDLPSTDAASTGYTCAVLAYEQAVPSIARQEHILRLLNASQHVPNGDELSTA
jgi:hypothetical protein